MSDDLTKTDNLRPAAMKHYLYIAVGSALGLGLSPIFPGTCGALLGVILHVCVILFLPDKLQFPLLVILFMVICASNHLLTPWAVEYWQSRDPKHFVLDEVAGYLVIPILFRPTHSWKIIIIGFILFRIFDIFKLIPPARYVDEHIHGAWGILLDDLVSGSYAALFIYFIYWLYPEWLTR